MSNSVKVVVLSLFLLISCNGKSDKIITDDTPRPPYSWETFIMGVDLSYVNELQDYGAAYSDSGKVTDPFLVLKNHGANTVRVRLWHNPQWLAAITGGKLYSDLPDVAKTIQRAKALGMAVSLDIHYSDTWADAGRQETPAAWEGLSIDLLRDSVYEYTLHVLNYLKSKGLTPEMIQLGNETNSGMLFPSGEVKNDNWQPFGELLNSGIKAIRDFSSSSDIKPRIILHVAQFQNAAWWVDGLMKKGKVTDFDILGISHYSKWSTMNRMDLITITIKNIRSACGKQVIIAESAYPWTGEDADSYANIFGEADSVTGYPLTKEGQYRYMKDLTQAIISGGGKGMIYWEPAWISTSMPDKWGTGSSWDNCTLFDWNGNALPSSEFMRFGYKF